MLNSSIKPQSRNIRTEAVSIWSGSKEKSSNFMLFKLILVCDGIIDSYRRKKRQRLKVESEDSEILNLEACTMFTQWFGCDIEFYRFPLRRGSSDLVKL